MDDQISTSDAAETEPTAEVNAGLSLQGVRKSSTAVKLIQAAALAAVLVPLGSIAMEGSSCTFYGGSGGGTSNCQTGPQGGLLFGFGSPLGSAPYKAELRFDETFGQFDVSIDDLAFSEADMLARFLQFPGYRPVPIGPDVATPFIEFRITDAPTPCTGAGCDTANNTWRSAGTRGPTTAAGYDLFLYWLAATDDLFPNPQMLHDTGGTDEQFDLNMTVAGSYSTVVPCVVFDSCLNLFADDDPAIGGRDDMFTGFTLADATNVPEPASLVLLGTGISGMLYRRRGRRQNADTPPSL